MKSIIRIGTRGSALALYQAEMIKTRILEDFSMLNIEIVKIKTSGDMIRRGGTSPLETKRIYTREIEESLLSGEVDIAVHSAKDMAAILPEGLTIGAVLEREDPRDCLVSRDKKILSQLPMGARIGTSSLRRKMQLLRWNPELIIEELHGNVDSRIKKVDDGEYDAVVLACAGLKRLGFSDYIAEVFHEHEFYPAPGQGTIVAQSRLNDTEMAEVFEAINCRHSAKRLECERAFLKTLEGGCQLPCGITTVIMSDRIQAAGALFAVEKHEWVEASLEGAAAEPAKLGQELAEMILKNGGDKILEQIRKTEHDKKHKNQIP